MTMSKGLSASPFSARQPRRNRTSSRTSLTSGGRAANLPRATYGMLIAHAGMAFTVAGITVGIASRIDPMALLAVPVILAVAATPVADDREPLEHAGRSRLVHFVGALAEGSIPAGGLNFNYNIGVGNGRGSVISTSAGAGNGPSAGASGVGAT